MFSAKNKIFTDLQTLPKCIRLYVTGFAKRYLFHTQNLTHFLNFKAS